MSDLIIGRTYESYKLIEDPWSKEKGKSEFIVTITDLREGWVRYNLNLNGVSISDKTEEEVIFLRRFQLKDEKEKS